ncbi:restriction endonuclease subunit S [Streptomyces caelestis]|uniref:restriction endonuclease subunit S n=1 Tax=Streptomyces caelestis TaxID=36816 RepID=UPI00344C255F
MSYSTQPLRRLFHVVNGGTPTADPENWGGEVPWATPSDFGRNLSYITTTRRTLTQAGARTGSTTVPCGSILLSTRAPIGYVGITSTEMAFNQGCRALVPRHNADARFFAYQLEARRLDLQAEGLGTTFLELSSDKLASFPVVTPLPDQQRRIADFLDAETTRIDRLAMKRDEQIATLSERELAIIGHALSGGATQSDGQPTGWPWLPYIPESWKIGPVYAYFSTELGKMLNADRATGQSQRPYLRNANVHWYEINTSDMATMHFDQEETQRYSVRRGDLLVCEGGAGVAEAAVWDGRIKECYFQKSLHRVRQAGPVPVEWLMYWLRFAKSCGVFSADGNIATIPHLTGEQLRQYRFPIPNHGQAIVANVSRAIHDISTVRDRLNQAQKLVAKRRESLITAAVTGQFDVSTASGRNVTEGVSA